jgi:hypothetical protein
MKALLFYHRGMGVSTRPVYGGALKCCSHASAAAAKAAA